MKRAFLDAQFYGTYRFASVVHDILRDTFPHLRDLEAFYCDEGYLAYVRPFPRESLLHCFIEFIVDSVVFEETTDVDLDERKQMLKRLQDLPQVLDELRPMELPVDRAFAAYGITNESFADWLRDGGKSFEDAHEDDIYDYYQELRLSADYGALLDRWKAEVFFLTFQNRQLLLGLNEMMADQLQRGASDTIPNELKAYFASPGVLIRVAIPSWVQRAVFYRDRGLCTLCQRDLSGLLAVGNTENYDHIVPLARGGLNDVTNIQLLCRACNAKKRDGVPVTSGLYEQWYALEPDQ